MTRHLPRNTMALALATGAAVTGCPGSNVPDPIALKSLGKGCYEANGKRLCEASPSPSPVPTASPTAAPSPTPTATASPQPAASDSPTPTPTPTATPAPTPTASPVPTPTSTPTPSPTPAPTPTATPAPTPTPPIVDPTELLTSSKVGSRYEFRLASLIFGNPGPDKKLDVSSGYAFWLGTNRLGYSATASIPCSVVDKTISCEGSRPGGPAIMSGDAGNVFAIKIALPPATQSLQPEGWMILRAAINTTPGSVTTRPDPVATGSLQLYFP